MRQVTILQSELEHERTTNEENKSQMFKMIEDIEQIGQQNNNREADLQQKLDEQLAHRRTDQIELKKANNEIARLQTLAKEQQTRIRQEQNNTKIMEMENEAMLRHTAMERENMHK